MKSIIPIALVALASLFFSACRQAEPSISTVIEVDESLPTEPTEAPVGMYLANVQINYATDELLSQFESFHEFIHEEEAEWILIWTDFPVNDFEYIKIGHDFNLHDTVFFMEYIEHPIGQLTPETPFLIKTYGHWGTLPHYGVSFTDVDNVKKYFYIGWSGYDGSLSLVEFESIFPVQNAALSLYDPIESPTQEKTILESLDLD